MPAIDRSKLATLGSAATAGNLIRVWCNNPVCPYWLEHGNPYRAVLTPVDLAVYAEKHGEAVLFDFRGRLRCRHWEHAPKVQ